MTSVFTSLMDGLRERHLRRQKAEISKADAYRQLVIAAADGTTIDPATADKILLAAGETPETLAADVEIVLKRRELQAIIRRYEENHTPEKLQAHSERVEEFQKRRQRIELELTAEQRKIEAEAFERSKEGTAARKAKDELREKVLPRHLQSLKKQLDEQKRHILNEQMKPEERGWLIADLEKRRDELYTAALHVD